MWKIIGRGCCGFALLMIALTGCAPYGKLRVYQSGKLIDERMIYWDDTVPARQETYQMNRMPFTTFRTSDALKPVETVSYYGTGASFVFEEE